MFYAIYQIYKHDRDRDNYDRSTVEDTHMISAETKDGLNEELGDTAVWCEERSKSGCESETYSIETLWCFESVKQEGELDYKSSNTWKNYLKNKIKEELKKKRSEAAKKGAAKRSKEKRDRKEYERLKNKFEGEE